MKIGYSPAPGERRTMIVVWEIDDPRKKGDGRYWWLNDDVEHLKKHSPEMPDVAGRPRGESLASLQRRAENGEVDFPHPPLPGNPDAPLARVPLDLWSDADPERTYFIVLNQRRPTKEEQEARKAEGFPWPDGLELLRQEWLNAEAAGEHERSAQAKQQSDRALAELGFRKAVDLSPWNPDNATEVRPGVFMQDERPPRPLD